MTMKCLKRATTWLVTVVAAVSTLITGTFAWQRVITRKNEFTGIKNGEYGSLTIEKAVTGAEAPESGAEFPFRVTFTGEKLPDKLWYTVNGEAAARAFENGDVIWLKGGERAVFTGLPVGAGYTVTELDPAETETETETESVSAEDDGAAVSEQEPEPETEEDPEQEPEIEQEPEADGENAPDISPDDESANTELPEIEIPEPQPAPEPEPEQAYNLDEAADESPEETAAEEIVIPESETVPLAAEPKIKRGYTALVREYSGYITGKLGVTLLFTNVYEASPPAENNYGGLELVKIVTGDSAETDRNFEFTVTFTGGSAPETYRREDGTESTFINGGTVYLKNGERALFTELASGTRYSVSERDYSGEGYLTSVTDAQGAIAEGETARLFVENRRDADDEKLQPEEPSGPVNPTTPPPTTPPTERPSEKPTETPPTEVPETETPETETPAPGTEDPNTPPETPEISPEVPRVPPTPSLPGNTVVPSPDGDGYIEVGEDGTPLGKWTWDDENDVWIFEPYPPLADFAPKTSDDSRLALWLTLFVASSVLLRIAIFHLKPRRSGEQSK